MAKKFDLGAYNKDTAKTQVKHSKYASFIENEKNGEDADEAAKTVTKAAGSKNDKAKKNASVTKDSPAASEKSGPDIKTGETKKTTSKKSVDRKSDVTAADNSPALSQTAEQNESKRINMAFTDANYELLTAECERMSISFVYLVNTLIRIIDEKDIDDHIGAQLIPKSKDNIMRRKGKPAKRINLKFSPELHEKLTKGADRYNMTITQYMNTIIEVYAQDINNSEA